MPQIPLIGGSYLSRVAPLDAQRCINLYPEVDESQGGKTVGALIGTPGLQLLTTLPLTGGVRGLFPAYNVRRIFAIQGTGFFEVFQDGTFVQHGSLATLQGPVSMASNGLQIMAVDGDRGYIFTLDTDTFEVITDADFQGGTHVTQQDGYFIVNVPNSRVFYISDILNGLSWNATEFGVKEANPDNIQALISDHSELWVIGEVTTEIFYNSGNLDFPFERIQGAFLEWGCLAPFSLARGDSALWWLAGNRTGALQVMRMQNYQGQRVSTHAVEFALKQSTVDELMAATAHFYLEEGHGFYCLSVGNQTWCYDVSTGLWHERAARGRDGNLDRARSQWSIAAFDTVLTGDYDNGNLYLQALDHYTDAGAPIIRQRATQYIGQDRQWFFPRALELDFERGVGLDGNITPGANPQAMLQWSDDDGRTWSNEHWADIGRLGSYRPRVQWHRLGRHRDRVYRVTISDPVKVHMVQAVLDG